MKTINNKVNIQPYSILNFPVHIETAESSETVVQSKCLRRRFITHSEYSGVTCWKIQEPLIYRRFLS